MKPASLPADAGGKPVKLLNQVSKEVAILLPSSRLTPVEVIDVGQLTIKTDQGASTGETWGVT